MTNHNFESPVKPTESFNPTTAASEHMMPSHRDFMESLSATKGAVVPRCDLPDFTIEGSGDDRRLIQTEKGKEYDALASEALNGAAQTDGKPASAKEQEIARQVAELSMKAQADLPKTTENMDRDNDIKQLHDIFEKLDPASAQRVINEANKTLEGQFLRLAQSRVGEIWMGSKNTSDEPYQLNARLKEVNCGPAV